MVELLSVKLRRIGSSLGIIIPKDKLEGVKEGETVEIALIPKHKDLSGFGMAKGFKPFVRDKTMRDFK
jgi:hypothetical protein